MILSHRDKNIYVFNFFFLYDEHYSDRWQCANVFSPKHVYLTCYGCVFFTFLMHQIKCRFIFLSCV